MPFRIHVNAGRAAADGGGPSTESELRRLLREAVRAALADRGCDEAEISLTLLSDPEIAALNRRYLGHDRPTDVISFPLHEPDEAPLGDIYIGWEHALRQARRLEVPPEEELVRLAVHGTLHVLGYEHPEGTARERSPMWRLQEAVTRRVVEADLP